MFRTLFLLAWTILAFASAQQLTLSTPRPTVGEPLTLSGEGLPPGSQVTAQLTNPGGTVTRESAQVDDQGAFSIETVLGAEGTWRLNVEGEGLSEARTLEVQAQQGAPRGQAEGGPPTAPSAPQGSEQTPDQQAPGEPDPQEPDQAVEDQPETPTEAPAQPAQEEAPDAANTEGDTEAPSSEAPAAQTPEAAVRGPTESFLNNQPVEVEALEFALDGDALVAREGGETVWRLGFPEGSGASTPPLLTEGQLFLGHGNSVLRLNPETGRVEERWILSGPVESVERVNELTTAITVRFAENLAERYALREGTLQDPVRFGLEPQVFGYLEAEAEVVDPAARLRQDPTNPWLYLATGLQQADDPDRARETFRQGIERAETFYDLAGLSQVLEENGERTLAEEAFNAAMQDFAARDYDPRLLRDPDLEAAYNFPLQPLQEALAERNDISAEFWAENLFVAAPDVEGAGEAFAGFAELITDISTEETIALWRSRARGSAGTGLGGLDNLASALGSAGWYAALAVVAAILALHLTLLAKYWRPQSGELRRQRVEGRGSGALARLAAIRYYTISEKLVLLLMFAAALALAALADWSATSTGLPLATRSGTLANRQAQEYLEQAEFSGSRGAFIRGYAAQAAENEEAARTLLEDAGSYPPALNNLGALTGDASLYERALEREPGLAVARYNLGQQEGGFPFHSRYRPDQPLLAVPTQADFQNALSGTWNTALRRAFTNPWNNLREATPLGLSRIVWNIIQVAFLLLVLITVLALFVPRPRSARNAPRNPVYHLLALLIPGSGLADEAWGVFLIIPWAVVGLDTLSKIFGWGLDLGLSLRSDLLILGIIYLVNTVAFIVEFLSYRQRMHEREMRAKGFGIQKA